MRLAGAGMADPCSARGRFPRRFCRARSRPRSSFFSTFLPGIADLLGLLILYIVLHLPARAGTLSKVLETARENLVPAVSWSEAFRAQGTALAAAGRWVFALTVYLALAAVVFSRRELPYGND